MSLKEAVNAPRIHFEKGKLNAEGGIDFDTVRQVQSRYPDQKIWKNKSLFFGGAHSVCIDGDRYSGAGDVRRGGTSRVL
jgi:gamma-glutamyltranspeptidase/glutathione hydrolase